MEKLLYRPKEAAQALGISRDKLYDLLRTGRLPSVKDGGARLLEPTHDHVWFEVRRVDISEHERGGTG